MKEDVQKTERDKIDPAWEQATKLFATPKAMRPRLSWLSGVSVDTGADRIQRLLRQSRKRVLYDLLNGLEGAALRCFLQRTEINLERAAAALRLNLVVNISVPVGALVLLNQLFPAVVANFVDDYGMGAFINFVICLLILVLLSIWYSYCAVTQARDLAHLTRLYVSRHFSTTGAHADYDDEPLNPVELA
ncbi:hypothetical protein [Hyphococcus sp.]|jgi:hypothetical protein|uniref:hypothetical protein n=1 Tax=Hyphococcus sp. TaxID=2038636 RepID=UPI003D0F7275